MGESRFEGKFLTEYLEEYHRMSRKDGESDWELRKRAFVEVFPEDPVAAVEFLYGCHMDELNPAEKTLVMILEMSRQTPKALKKFADGFAGDPMLWKSKAPTNPKDP